MIYDYIFSTMIIALSNNVGQQFLTKSTFSSYYIIIGKSNVFREKWLPGREVRRCGGEETWTLQEDVEVAEQATNRNAWKWKHLGTKDHRQSHGTEFLGKRKLLNLWTIPFLYSFVWKFWILVNSSPFANFVINRPFRQFCNLWAFLSILWIIQHAFWIFGYEVKSGQRPRRTSYRARI